MKKVLFVIHSLGNAGAERVCLDLVKGLDFDKIIFQFQHKSTNTYEDELSINIKNYKINKVRLNILRLIFSSFFLYKIIKNEKPHIVIGFSPYSNLLILLTKKIFLKNKFYAVITWHTMFDDLVRDYGRIKKFLWKNLILYLYNNADVIISVALSIEKRLKQLLTTDKEKFITIYNYVDLKKIERKKSEPIKLKEEFIISIGRLELEKNFIDLIDTFNLIKEHINLNLYILGDGSLKSLLQDKIETLGLESRVRLIGFQKNPFKYIKRSKFLVLNSIYEGFGNVIIEAMACKVAVISSDCMGPCEIITHMKNGIIVPKNNNKRLAEAMLLLAQDNNLRKYLGENGFLRAQDFTKSIDQYQYIMESL